ncbi:MAG: hypothetical protein R3Y54_03565 [Eubacteriales bacterium]
MNFMSVNSHIPTYKPSTQNITSSHKNRETLEQTSTTTDIDIEEEYVTTFNPEIS